MAQTWLHETPNSSSKPDEWREGVHETSIFPYTGNPTEVIEGLHCGALIRGRRVVYMPARRSFGERRADAANSTENLRERLANANGHFRRKATEVFNDEAALKLLADMYRDVVVNLSEFDACKNGIPLAKLTAANFCEVGATVVYITEAGQRFIDSIEGAWASLDNHPKT